MHYEWKVRYNWIFLFPANITISTGLPRCLLDYTAVCAWKPRSAEEKRIIWRPLWECGQTDLPQRGPHRSVWPHCCSLAWNEMNCSQWMIGQFLIFWKWFKGDWRFMVIYPVPTVIYGSFGPNDSTHRFITTTMSIISNCYGTFGRQQYDR